MVERIIRRPGRVAVRRPLPPPPESRRPVPHAVKKPKLASTGTRADRLCAVCLGVLEPGDRITFCKCGKFFHMDCIMQVGQCPLCGYGFPDAPPAERQEGRTGMGRAATGNTTPEDGGDDVMEEVYQCPVCQAYVSPEAETCRCGAVFKDFGETEYLCPGCGAVVEPDAGICPECGLVFGTDA